VKFILRFIDWVLNTSLFTAACAVGLSIATGRLVGGSVPAGQGQPEWLKSFLAASSLRELIPENLHLFIFGSTLLVYNTPRLIRKPYGRARLPAQNRYWYMAIFIAGLLMVLATIGGLPVSILYTGAGLSIFAFAYFLPLLPFGGGKRLRDFGWLKILVLAGVWTTATAVLPILYLKKNLLDYPFEILLRFFFIFALCVVFDIRDMQADMRNNIITLPHRLGIKTSYSLIDTSLLLFVFLSVMQYLRYPVAERLAGALITAIITRLIVDYLKKHPSDRAYNGLADGVMLVYAMLVIYWP
jgi:4-hydroxybenzoate polyprenyltransferase